MVVKGYFRRMYSFCPSATAILEFLQTRYPTVLVRLQDTALGIFASRMNRTVRLRDDTNTPRSTVENRGGETKEGDVGLTVLTCPEQCPFSETDECRRTVVRSCPVSMSLTSFTSPFVEGPNDCE